MSFHHPIAGPSRSQDDSRRERKRKDIANRTSRDPLNDRRDDLRHTAETIQELQAQAHMLATRSEDSPSFRLRLLPLTIERAAYLAQYEWEERRNLEHAQVALQEECDRVQDEWKLGVEKARERLMESIEDRRRRAREDKDREDLNPDTSLDSQSRPHVTRKLRGKGGGISPPSTPLLGATGSLGPGVPLTFLDPHSLAVDDIPSPFPLTLSASATSGVGGSAAGSGPGVNKSGRRTKNGTAPQNSLVAKSLVVLYTYQEAEIDEDLSEIRKAKRQRRRAANASQPAYI